MVTCATRDSALQRLESFLPQAVSYSRQRNFVKKGHPDVSLLSAPIRCRLITEYEVADAALKQCGLTKAEKFIQEVYWRAYWKGWLEQRPQVWSHYREKLQELREDAGLRNACAPLENGETGVEPIDSFARELLETGYMHNHARMWFASYWIHVARLPWQWGADFFYRHLLDADPASNTLSWKWVAGLQTPGKTYLIRKSNIESCCASDYPRANLDSLDEYHPVEPEPEDPAMRTPHPLPDVSTSPPPSLDGKAGLWLHGDDLTPETGPLSSFRPDSICAVCSLKLFDAYSLSEMRQAYMQRVMVDALQRSGDHFNTSPECRADSDIPATVTAWAKDHGLVHVVAMLPTVGPLRDKVAELESHLDYAGIQIHWFRRKEDQEIWPHAQKGFFPFWKSVRQSLDPQLGLGL